MPDLPALRDALARTQSELDTADRAVRDAWVARNEAVRTYQHHLESWAVATEQRDKAKRALREAEHAERFRQGVIQRQEKSA